MFGLIGETYFESKRKFKCSDQKKSAPEPVRLHTVMPNKLNCLKILGLSIKSVDKMHIWISACRSLVHQRLIETKSKQF